MSYENGSGFAPKIFDALSRFLMWEWNKIITGYFGRSMASRIKKPQLCFTNNASYLGRFVSAPICRIELNRNLVLNHSWCAVQSVFCHEVAHQITHIVYPGVDIMPHGKEFREVCRRIGALPDASVEIVSLDEQLSNENRHSSGMEEKLRKLLTLAKDGDANEAQVALSKALELMSKYGITEDDINAENEYVTAQLGEPLSRIDVTCHQISRILSEFWGVYAVFSYQPNIQNPEKDLKIITISGPKDKVTIALYVYDYIMNNMKLAYERAKPRLFGRNSKRDFCSGYLKGISEKLRGVADDGQVYALIHKCDAGTKEYVSRRFGSLHLTRSSGIQINEDAIDQGFSEGSKLDINPGVSEGGGKRLLKE